MINPNCSAFQPHYQALLLIVVSDQLQFTIHLNMLCSSFIAQNNGSPFLSYFFVSTKLHLVSAKEPMRYLYLYLFSIHLMSNDATSILLFSCKHSLIAFMWNILAQKVFQVINLSSPFVSVFTILNVRKLLTPNSLDAVTCNCRGAPCSRFNSWLLNGLLYKRYIQTNYHIDGKFLQQVEVSLQKKTQSQIQV